MARYIPGINGPLVGSIGSQTFSKNRYGFYVKNKPIPTNPNTAPQAIQRAILRDLVDYWKSTLTLAQSDAWVHAAALHKRSKWGASFSLSGINLFVAVNSLLLKNGVAILTAPTIFHGGTPSVLPAVTEVVLSGKLELSAWTESEANVKFQFYATDAVPQTTHYRNRPFVFNTYGETTTVWPTLIDVVYPGTSLDTYRVFWGVKFFDLRGSCASMIEGWTDGAIV